MKTIDYSNHAGFTLIEMLAVFAIIGALASIAIPHYAEYKEKALEAQCLSNRYHIETEELAYFAENEKVSLKIDDKYKCPSGGTYVWLNMDPENLDYPKIGCSIHFIGATPVMPEPPVVEPPVTPTPEPPVVEPPVTPTPEPPAVEPPIPVTPEPPVVEPPPPEKPSPAVLTDSLTKYLGTLSIQKNTAKQLLDVLDSAKTSIAKGDDKKAINSLDSFINKVNARKGKTINAEEADILISKAEEIRANL
jgi:prepilin-type N-terminal cleavage/methylation domain-containing protein